VELNPSEVYPYTFAYGFVLLYLGHAIGLLLVVQIREKVSPRFSLLSHVADVLWPAIISLFGSGAPFFLYFIFALLAAALRWGMRETALTMIAVIATMAADTIARSRTPLAAVFGEPSLTSFAIRSAYSGIFAF